MTRNVLPRELVMYGVTWTHLTQSLHAITGYSLGLHSWLLFGTLVSNIVMPSSHFLDAPTEGVTIFPPALDDH